MINPQVCLSATKADKILYTVYSSRYIALRCNVIWGALRLLYPVSGDSVLYKLHHFRVTMKALFTGVVALQSGATGWRTPIICCAALSKVDTPYGLYHCCFV